MIQRGDTQKGCFLLKNILPLGSFSLNFSSLQQRWNVYWIVKQIFQLYKFMLYRPDMTLRGWLGVKVNHQVSVSIFPLENHLLIWCELTKHMLFSGSINHYGVSKRLLFLNILFSSSFFYERIEFIFIFCVVLFLLLLFWWFLPYFDLFTCKVWFTLGSTCFWCLTVGCEMSNLFLISRANGYCGK